MQFSLERTEVDVLEEEHDVDERSEESSSRTGRTEDLRGDVLMPELLMPDGDLDL